MLVREEDGFAGTVEVNEVVTDGLCEEDTMGDWLGVWE